MSYPPGPPGPPGGSEPQPGHGQAYPPPAYGQQPYGGPPPVPSAVPPTNQKATAALITGITTLVLSWCCGLGVLGAIAVVLGIRARAEIRRSGGAESGDGIAIAGIVTGAVAIVVGLVVAVAMVLVVASGQAAFQDYGTTY